MLKSLHIRTRPLGSSATRLLLLYPGKAEDTLRGSTIHVVINLSQHVGEEEPTYEALLYMWGPEESFNFISVDGKFLPLRSLPSAAHRLDQEAVGRYHLYQS